MTRAVGCDTGPTRYVQVKYNRIDYKTETVYKTLNPKFKDNVFEFCLASEPMKPMELMVSRETMWQK